jgi:hypothetical protein
MKVIGSQISDPTIIELFGFSRNSNISDKDLSRINKSFNLIGDTSLFKELLRSFSKNFSLDKSILPSKFLKFIEDSKKSNSIVDYAKENGLMTKDEVEEEAKETGDWSRFLKKSSEEIQERSYA